MHRQRPLSRFVGRERELAVLVDLLGQAREGRGQLVGIVGEAGVGKSRLCNELMQTHSTQGWRLLATSADAPGQASPYLPLIELLKSYFQIASRDAVETRRDKIADQLRTVDQPLASSLPALFTLLDVPVEDAVWQALDPSQRRQQLLSAIKRVLIRESQIQPTLAGSSVRVSCFPVRCGPSTMISLAEGVSRTIQIDISACAWLKECLRKAAAMVTTIAGVLGEQ